MQINVLDMQHTPSKVFEMFVLRSKATDRRVIVLWKVFIFATMIAYVAYNTTADSDRRYDTICQRTCIPNEKI